jgi:hypothetical protein
VTAAPRYEFKIPLAPVHLHHVESWVRLHPAHWRVSYPPRRVNNIYFDSPGYASLNANVQGLGSRSKLRLRWYGPHLRRVAGGRFELKRKEGMVGWKETHPFEGEWGLEGTWSALLGELRARTGERARLWLDAFSLPSLVNHYRRAYYETPDGLLRLTLDTELCAYAQGSSSWPNLTRPEPVVERVVVELKAPVEPRAYRRLAAVLNDFPARVDRHSKYVQGMLAAAHLEGVELL